MSVFLPLQLHQNSQATEILEQLFQVHDALGEQLSVEASLLLIETYMSTYRLEKAASQIELLETKLYGDSSGKGEGEGEGPTQQCRAQLHLFKAQLHLLHRNVKACKKELKNFISTAGNVSEWMGCAEYVVRTVSHSPHSLLVHSFSRLMWSIFV